MASSLEPIVVLSLIVGVIAALIFAGVLVALILFTVRYRDPRPGPPGGRQRAKGERGR